MMLNARRIAFMFISIFSYGNVYADELTATIGAGPDDGLTFTATCSPNSNGQTQSYYFQVEGKTAGRPFIANMSVTKNGVTKSVNDPTNGNGQPGPNAALAAGDGVYTVVLSKEFLPGETSTNGNMLVGVTSHCQAANGGHTAQQMSAPIPIQIPDPNPKQLLTLTKSGLGTVTSEPFGIDCGVVCTKYFYEGLTVSLFAVPATHYTFGGWFGDGCSGTEACVVTMDKARTIYAVFIPPKKPSAPTEVTPLSGNAKAEVSWKASQGIVDGYRVEAYTADTVNPPSVGACEAKPPNTSCEVVNLINGAMYRFRVLAYGPGGTSDPSGFSEWAVPGSPPVNAVCGTANGVLTNDPPSHVDLCLAGHATTLKQDDAKAYLWSCIGVGGGASINCRTGGPLPVYPEPTAKLYVTLKTKNPQFKTGVVKSQPIGIDCGARCGYSFTKGSSISLSVTPQDGAKFNGWSGACSHKKLTCTFKLRKDKQVTAKFK